MKSVLVSPISQQCRIVGISKSLARSSSCTMSYLTFLNPPSCFHGSHYGRLTSLFHPTYGYPSLRSSRSFSLSAASKLDQRLLFLRHLFLRPGIDVDAYIVPSHDAHQSEFMAERFMRLAYISDFTGSAGTAIITKNKAALWTDGRYFLQAEKQLSSSWVLMRSGNADVPTTSEWINDVLDPGSRIGIDPFLFSTDSAEELKGEIAKKDHQLVYLYDCNLIDEIWGDSRPKSPDGPLRIHELNYAGFDVLSKLTSVRSELLRTGCSALVISMLDEIAWLLNLRGSDVPHSPVMYAYLIVEISGATLLINKSKVTRTTNEHLQHAGIDIMPYESILSEIERLASMGACLWLDTSSVNAAIVDTYKSAYIKNLSCKGSSNADRNTDRGVQCDPSLFCETSPVALTKAVKNTAELEGMCHCHLRDAAALVEFLTWLEEEITNGVKLTEVEVGDELIKYRSRQDGFVDTSFETISAFGANGSIVHYIPEQSTCATVDITNLFLLDSGAQYVDGTTDVTRTLHFGQPTTWQKECFTRVLQGHIAVDQAVFPEDTPGFVLDAFARSFLWKIGLDYRHEHGIKLGVLHRPSREWRMRLHMSSTCGLLNYRSVAVADAQEDCGGATSAGGDSGRGDKNLFLRILVVISGTGHGVGAALNVHEGPQSISFRFKNTTSLQAGMVVSNEPGYYEDHAFGIRIENLLFVKEMNTPHHFGGKRYLGFKKLTFVPIQTKMIDMSLISDVEVSWINEYHDQVWAKVSPLVKGERAYKWLRYNTRPLPPKAPHHHHQ